MDGGGPPRFHMCELPSPPHPSTSFCFNRGLALGTAAAHLTGGSHTPTRVTARIPADMARLALVFLSLVGTATAAALVQPPEPATSASIADPRAAAALVALNAARVLDPATAGHALAGVIAMPPGLDARVLGKLFYRPGSSGALPPSKEVENHLKGLASSYVLGGRQGFDLASTPIGNVLFPPEETPATHQEMSIQQSSPATKLISSSSAVAAGFFLFFLLQNSIV